eukprot:scaffold72479_cov49-Attheya_sp.AAC.4
MAIYDERLFLDAGPSRMGSHQALGPAVLFLVDTFWKPGMFGFPPSFFRACNYENYHPNPYFPILSFANVETPSLPTSGFLAAHHAQLYTTTLQSSNTGCSRSRKTLSPDTHVTDFSLGSNKPGLTISFTHVHPLIKSLFPSP